MQIDTSPRPKPPPPPPWWSGLERMILRAALYLALIAGIADLFATHSRYDDTAMDSLGRDVERTRMTTVLVVSLGALAISARRRK